MPRLMFRAAACALLLAAGAAPALAQTDAQPFLAPAERLDVTAWLPPTPAPGSLQDRQDRDAYLQTRALLAGPRGQVATDDDVYLPPDLALRFADALGVRLTPAAAPRLMQLLKRAERDAEVLTDPIKQDLPAGRIRPFVDYPDQPKCVLKPDDLRFKLPQTGSYPSVHSALGMIFAMVFSELEPARADALVARGLDFGMSRVVCGFHYPSDVTSGRLAGLILYARMSRSPAFRAEMDAAKAEYAAIRRP